jgi:hypothetical protein
MSGVRVPQRPPFLQKVKRALVDTQGITWRIVLWVPVKGSFKNIFVAPALSRQGLAYGYIRFLNGSVPRYTRYAKLHDIYFFLAKLGLARDLFP